MNKPNNFDNTTVGSEFVPVELGGHKCRIESVEERKTSNGKDMLMVKFEFDGEDHQPGWMKDHPKKDGGWSATGTRTIFVQDFDGNTSKDFKGFCTAFEDSNNREVVFGDAFVRQFAGKKIGVVFGEEEYEAQDGSVKVARKARWWCNYKKAFEQNVPNLKTLKKKDTAAEEGTPSFMQIPDDEELPFN